MQWPPLRPKRPLVSRRPLGFFNPSALQSWQDSFGLDGFVSPTSEQGGEDDTVKPSAYNSDEPQTQTDTDSVSETNTYESEAPHADDIDPGTSRGTATENVGLLEVKPEEKIDQETLELLARNFYQLLRMRLEEEQDSRMNRISGLTPWADIITFPIIGNSKSTVPKILQTESSAPAFMIDRKISHLSEELYQHLLSRILSERCREGWLYSR